MYPSKNTAQYRDRSHLQLLQPLTSDNLALPPSSLPASTTTLSESQPKLAASSAGKSRRRGVVLSESGWQKLLQANVIYNDYGERHNFEYLSTQTMLDPRTICRIVDREIGVDRRTLKTFFTAFNLKLEETDFSILATYERENYFGSSITAKGRFSVSESSYANQDVALLKQRIVNNAHRLAILLGIDRNNQTTLSVKLPPQAPPLLEISSQLY